jgi:hypothetical protein
LEKYGKEWVSKVDSINAKQQSGGYSYYDFEFPSGKVVRVQGYEPKVLAKLVVDYSEGDIIVGVQNIINEIGFFHYEYENETHRYYPDIYIKSENRIIEVKSTYTFNKEKEKNLLKRESVLNKNINKSSLRFATSTSNEQSKIRNKIGVLNDSLIFPYDHLTFQFSFLLFVLRKLNYLYR